MIPKSELVKLESGAVERYLAKCDESGLTPDVDRFVGSLRGLQQIGAEYFVDQKFQGDFGKFTGEQLRARHMLEFHNQWVKTKRTPHPNLIVRTEQDQAFDMVVGSFESTWSHMVQEGQKGVIWMIEVMIMLSQQLRNRCGGIVLISPHIKKPDLSVKTVRDHLENMKERVKFSSRMVGRWNFLLEEHERFDQGFYKDSRHLTRDMNVTVDGLIRKIEDVLQYSDPQEGPVQGDPMIRIHLDHSYGIVIKGSHLKQAEARSFVKSWIWDIVEFTNRRDRFWDAEKDMYVTQSLDRERPPFIPMQEIWEGFRNNR